MTKTLSATVGIAALLLTSSVLAAPLFLLQSPDFADNAMLQQKFARNAQNNPNCTGSNQSPTLIWSNPPAATQSFALLIVDPEGARGLGVSHLVAYNIPAASTGFPANALRDGKGYTGGKNTPGNLRYDGPCPPQDSGAHHYVFTLIATDLAPTLAAGLTREQLLDKLNGHALAATGLVGRFGQ